MMGIFGSEPGILGSTNGTKKPNRNWVHYILSIRLWTDILWWRSTVM